MSLIYKFFLSFLHNGRLLQGLIDQESTSHLVPIVHLVKYQLNYSAIKSFLCIEINVDWCINQVQTLSSLIPFL